MSKANTKANINANIKTNGNQGITGAILNSVLNTMVDDYADEAKVTNLESQVNTINGKLNLSNGSASGAENVAFYNSVKYLFVSNPNEAEGTIYYVRLFGFFTNKVQLTITKDKSSYIDLTLSVSSVSGVQEYILTNSNGYTAYIKFDWDTFGLTRISNSEYQFNVLNAWSNKHIIDLNIENLDTRVTAIENESFGTSTLYGDYELNASTRQTENNTVVTPCKKAVKGGKVSKIFVKSDVTGKATIYVGAVDQLYLFVARNSYELDVVSGNNTIDVSSMNIYINEGETIAYKYNGARFLATKTGTPEGDISFYYGNATGNPLQLQVFAAAKAITFAFGYEIDSSKSIDTDAKIDKNTNDIESLQSSVINLQSVVNVVTDSQGNKYKIVVSNNALALRALNFKHLLCVGNSYTTHPTTTDTETDYRNNLWWGHRAMASSSSSIAWTTLLQSVLRTKRADAVVTPIFGRRYETNPNTYGLTNSNTFQYWNGSAWTSLPNNLASFSDVDCVFFFLGDNYTGDSWYSLYKPMIQKFMEWFPNASIFCGSCNGTSKTSNNNAIAQTASELGATYVNMTSIGGASKLGNYVLDDSNTLHQINNQAVANHIGDYGQYLMLERICPAIGYTNNVTLYDVTINGNATTKDAKYIPNAIVSVFLGEGATSVSVVGADGNAVTATDMGTTDYGHIFTFTMPSKDVSITIS